MKLQKANEQLDAIWTLVARNETFRGYRPATVAASGILGMVAAGCQSWVVTEPVSQPALYVGLWVGVAFLAVLMVAAELILDYRYAKTRFQKKLTWKAVRQFLPAMAIGAGLTVTSVYCQAPNTAVLPGLWAICFGLGIFASVPYLGGAVSWVGVYYLLAGLLSFLFANGETACSPWQMGLSFGVGQLLSAWVLYQTRFHDGQE